MPTVLIVDADNYVTTQFKGGQGDRSANDMIQVIRDFRIEYGVMHVVACFDGGSPTWRHELYADYKAGRGPKEPELIAQLAEAYERCQEDRISTRKLPFIEADDTVATVARQYIEEGFRAVVFTRDRDAYQLLEQGQITILKKANKRYPGTGREWEYYTAANLATEHGLVPGQWVDYRALAGDTSDHWPGCPGIGDKTAKELLKKTDTLALAIELAHTSPRSLGLSDRLLANLLAFDWQLARKLMALRCDVCGRNG